MAGCAPPANLVEALDAALPQTQCTRCGYPDCRAYAEAIASGAAINRCPPGGQDGVRRLARIADRPELPLDAQCGSEGPLRQAVIDEAACIGCTLCIAACPVDAIVGASKSMHTVIEAHCTGCELCLPACPVDCIALVTQDTQRTGWSAWSAPQAEQAGQRYARHRERTLRGAEPATAPALPDKGATIAAALERARAQRRSAS